MHRFQPLRCRSRSLRCNARFCTAVLLIAAVPGLGTAAARQRPMEVVTPDGQRHVVDLDGLPAASVSAVENDAKVGFDGVLLTDVLAAAGVPRGAALRGPALGQFVLIEARDGYRVVFTLAELDKGFSDRVVLLAHRRNGALLDQTEGPLRIVVPDEARHGRWIRQVQRISVRDAR